MDFIDEYYADKDLSLLKKLTLVIPTYNRNYYLSRCLWYHAHFPFGEIIVADSSPEEKKVVNRETVQKIREMFGAKIRYLEYEPETEKYGGDIIRKWGDAVQHVETEYSLICTDKEFRLPLSLVESISYLDSHQDYIISHCGNFYYVISQKNNLEKTLIYKQKYKKYEICLDNIYVDRLNSFIGAYTGGWENSQAESTWRSYAMKQIYSQINDNKINDIRYGEMHIAYSGYLLGKCHHNLSGYAILKDITKYKPIISKKNTESSAARYPGISTYKYLSTNIGRDYFERYKNEIKYLLTEVANYDKNTIQTFVNEDLQKIILGRYLGRYLQPPFENEFWWNMRTKSRMVPIVCDILRYVIIHVVRNSPKNEDKIIETLYTTDQSITIILKIISETIHMHDSDSIAYTQYSNK